MEVKYVSRYRFITNFAGGSHVLHYVFRLEQFKIILFQSQEVLFLILWLSSNPSKPVQCLDTIDSPTEKICCWSYLEIFTTN